MRKAHPTLGYLKNVLVPVLFYSGLSGVIVGVIVSLYNLAANKLVDAGGYLYSLVREHEWAIPIMLVVLVAIALIVHLLLKITPECKGSGVPRTEGVLRGILSFRWLRVLFTTIAASLLTFFSGMSLGSEGPSIQIGATTAQGASDMLRCRSAWRTYAMSGGAGAGLAVAFNAPLTGIIFVLEEVHKRFTPMLVMTAAAAVLTGTLTSNALSLLWGGSGYLFAMGDFVMFPISGVWRLILLGIVIGLASVIFNLLITKSNKFVAKYFDIPDWAKLIFAFVITGVFAYFYADSIGGGHHMIMKIGNMDFALQTLLILAAVKLFLIVVGFNSGATGGLFIPMLSIGALIGGIGGHVFVSLGMDPIYYKTIVVVAMAGFFGACVRTPLTAIVLIVEVTGQLSGFLMTGITIMVAYFVAELFKVRPLYDALLEPIVEKENNKRPLEVIQLTITVTANSFAIHKSLRDIMWPPNCLLLNIERGNKILVPDGETRFMAGDRVLIQAETRDSAHTTDLLYRIFKE